MACVCNSSAGRGKTNPEAEPIKKKKAAIDGGRLMMPHVGEHTSTYDIHTQNL